MHIVDGALSMPVLIGASTLAVAGIAKGVRELDLQRIPAAGLLSAVFFVASLVHVPIGPSSLHLIMNGLAGLILGWIAFPALFIGLLLQAVLFGFGGLTVLGVNTLNIALPAVIVFFLCRRGVAGANATLAAVWGALAGALAIALTALSVAAVLALSGEAFIPAAQLVVITHVPVMVVEGLLCAAAVTLIRRVRPDLLGVVARSASAKVALSGLLLLALFCAALPAVAHKVVLSAWPLGHTIEGELGFSSGSMAKPGTRIEVFGPDGERLGETAVDADGLFRYRPTAAVPHTLRPNLGAGHVAETTLSVDELPAIATAEPVPSAAGQGVATASDGDAPNAVPDAVPKAAANATGRAAISDPDALKTLIASAVQREIRPLRRELTRLRESQRLHEIIGGIGYIAGLFGVLFFVYARREQRG